MPYPTFAVLSVLTTTPQSLHALAQQLGQSEAQTQEQLQTLTHTPAPLLVSEAGYALAKGTPAPRLVPIRGKLGRTLRYLPQVGSTQQEVSNLAEEGAVVVAEEQLQGRGRRGKAWQSSAKSLMFSVLLPPQDLTLLPLACGVALQAACGLGQLKWPNDLLAPDGRKLAGILLEADWQGGKLRQLVLGIGINIHSAPAGAAALSEWHSVNRAELLAEVLWQLEHWLTQPPAAILAAWRGVAALRQQVNIQTPAGKVQGTARNIDEAGALWVETASGPQRITAGEVQLIGLLTALTFRAATPSDAPQAAPLLLEANGDLALHLTGSDTPAQAQAALQELFEQTGQRFSHQNAWIAERGGEVLGAAIVYHGEDSVALDQPLQRRLQGLGKTHTITSEGKAGEWYLDTLAVSAATRGQGIGAQFLQHLQGQAQQRGRPLALLVEDGNPARRLYERLGFAERERQELGGHGYTRMVWAAAQAHSDS